MVAAPGNQAANRENKHRPAVRKKLVYSTILTGRAGGLTMSQVGHGGREQPLQFGLSSAKVAGLACAQLHHASEAVFNSLALSVGVAEFECVLLCVRLGEDFFFGVFGEGAAMGARLGVFVLSGRQALVWQGRAAQVLAGQR